MVAATRFLAKIIPVDAGKQLYEIVQVDPSIGIWPGPGGELPPYPSHPIALPGDPWWGTIGDRPPTVTPPPDAASPANAVIIPLPPTEPPTAPPPTMAPEATQILVWFGPGTKPATGWLNPYVSTGPVPPPTVTPA